MKIIRKSNYDHEDWRGDQYVVADNIQRERQAKIMCEALNEHGYDEDYFMVVPDDYVLTPKWKP